MNNHAVIPVPSHVAIIMDGNGRWAQRRGLPRTAGHKAGAQRLKEVVRAAGKLGISTVTFFAFSHENWSRPSTEINMLMRLLDMFLKREIREMNRNNVRLRIIGRRQRLPLSIYRSLQDAQELTKDNTGIRVVLALNYGARQEIVDAARRIAREAADGRIAPESLTESGFEQFLYTDGIPDPDLLIRTSGEMRLSNFLLWQLSYAELYFEDKYWPDFTARDFETAVKAYQTRKRRFGGV